MNTRMITWVLTVSAVLLTAGPNRLLADTMGNDTRGMSPPSGQVVTNSVIYSDGSQELDGYLAYDPSVQGKRPGILVVHEWWGLNDYPKRRARELAQMGYVVLAADVYGQGQVTADPDKAGKLAGLYRADRALMQRRVAAALAILKANPRVDPKRIAAIGYCFGGTCVLELARSGADLAGIVSFHGGLDTPHPESTPKPKPALLVCHGAADPYTTPETLDAFRREMNGCGADWQLNMYGEAVHSFTNPNAGNDPSKGAAYNATADKRSWADMTQFLRRVLAADK